MIIAPATNPLNLSTYTSALALLAVVSPADVNFLALLPQTLNYAELRIQRDLDLLPLQYENLTYSTTTGANTLALSVNDFVTVQTVSVITGTQKVPLAPVSKEFIQFAWPDSSVVGAPRDFALLGGDAATGGVTSTNLLFGPYADAAYLLSIVGTNRAPSLYVQQGGTFISTFLPDLLLMASMIFISGYQRNFSANSDDPQMAANYEKQYQTLLHGAQGEELRKRWSASGWTSTASSPAATPART